MNDKDLAEDLGCPSYAVGIKKPCSSGTDRALFAKKTQLTAEDMTELGGSQQFTVEAFFQDCHIDTTTVERELDAFLECHTENGVLVGIVAGFALSCTAFPYVVVVVPFQHMPLDR